MNAAELFGHWQSVRRGLIEALDKLSDKQLRFVPCEGLWSLGTVACHIANAEEGWFRYVVTRELDKWPPLEEEKYATIASIKALLDEVEQRTESYLATLDIADLEQTIAAPWGEEFPLRWVVWHVLEHEYHQTQLANAQAPDV